MDLEVPRSIRGGGTNKVKDLRKSVKIAKPLKVTPRQLLTMERERLDIRAIRQIASPAAPALELRAVLTSGLSTKRSAHDSRKGH